MLNLIQKCSLCLLLLVFCCCNPPSQERDEKALISKVLEVQAAAWNEGDLEGYMQGYWKSDSLIFTGGKNITYGWENALSRYQKSYPDKETMGHLSFSEVQTELTADNSAFTVGQWQLNRNLDTLKGRFTLVWIRRNGHWMIAADHSS